MGWNKYMQEVKAIFKPEPEQGGQSHAPPPVPGMETRPSMPYWQPQFRPDIPISQDWDPKIGNGPDGWGNQELQYYTSDSGNAF